jgi:hypothetical protein
MKGDMRPGAGAASAAATGRYVLNLCSSTMPLALPQLELPGLERFTFFTTRRFEEGRERYRLHMGYFDTLAEAQEWLALMRDIYPGAWASQAFGQKAREASGTSISTKQQQSAPPRSVPVLDRPRSSTLSAPPPRTEPQVATAAVVPVVPALPPARRSAPHSSAGRAPVSPPPHVLEPPARPPTAYPKEWAPLARAAAGIGAAATSGARAAGKARKSRQPLPEASNVREVLASLGEDAAPEELEDTALRPSGLDDSVLSDNQVQRFLEMQDASAEPADAESAISLLKPEDTATRRALGEALARSAPVFFAVQLECSAQPAQLTKLKPLGLFSMHTLYIVEALRDGQKCYGLRLGFFSDARSAKQLASRIRADYTQVAVVPVSPEERARATGQAEEMSAAPLDATLETPRATDFGPMGQAPLNDPGSGLHRLLQRSPPFMRLFGRRSERMKKQ